MLISEFLILSILIYKERLFSHFVCPMTIFFGLGYWRHMPFSLHKVYNGWTTFSMIRVFIIFCFGWYCYKLSRKLQKCRFTSFGVFLLSLLEFGGLLLVFGIIMLTRGQSYIFVFCFLLLIICAITISGQSISAKIFQDSKTTRYLGKLSFSVFLIHLPVLIIYRTHYTNEYVLYSHKISFGLVTLAAAILFSVFSAWFVNLFSRLWITLKSNILRAECG